MPVYLKHQSGREVLALASSSPCAGLNGERFGCLILLRDILADVERVPEIQDRLTTLDSILRYFPTPFFTVDPDLKITYMNECLEKLSGYSREEAVGKMTCAELLCTEQCHTDQCLLQQSMENMHSLSGIRRVIKNRGDEQVPVVISASIITDPNGKVIGGFEAFRDITPMVEAEKKIELLIEMSQEGILIIDRSYRISFANYRMAAISGRSKQDLIGADVREILSGHHLRLMTEMFHKSEQNKSQQQMCFYSTVPFRNHEQDSQRTFQASIAVSHISNSTLCFLYFRDLTERIETERQLQAANSFLENIIQSIVEGIVVLDTKGNVVMFNHGAERILGCRAEEVIGHREMFEKIYPAEQARALMQRMRSDEYGPPGLLNTTEVLLTNEQGERVPVNFSAAIIKEGHKEIASVGIFSDLRERRRMERELEEARLQVIHAEKIASLGRLAAGVAHEINNPLAGILLYADMLLKEISHNEAWRQDLEEIITQTLRCKEIVTRLLDFSRQSLGQRCMVEISRILGQSLDLLRRQSLFLNIEIHKDFQPGLALQGDAGQLRQVFTNLMINAADAMEGKGTLTLRTRLEQTQQQAVIEISDTGSGIDSEALDKIFEPFFTTKSPGKGTGLGLSIVYGVIQRHGGTIDAASTPGKGTTFTIRLPLEATGHWSNRCDEDMLG